MKTIFVLFEITEIDIVTECSLSSNGLTTDEYFGARVFEELERSESKQDLLQFVADCYDKKGKSTREFSIQEIISIKSK